MSLTKRRQVARAEKAARERLQVASAPTTTTTGGRRKRFSRLGPLVHAPDVATLVQLKEREGITSNRESDKKKTGRTRQKVGTQTTMGGECIDDESAHTYDLLAACAHAVPPACARPGEATKRRRGQSTMAKHFSPARHSPSVPCAEKKNANRKGEREQRFRSAKCNIGSHNSSREKMHETKCDASNGGRSRGRRAASARPVGADVVQRQVRRRPQEGRDDRRRSVSKRGEEEGGLLEEGVRYVRVGRGLVLILVAG